MNKTMETFVRVVAFLLIVGLVMGSFFYAIVSLAANYTSPEQIAISTLNLWMVLVIAVITLAGLLLLVAPILLKKLKLAR